MPTTSNYFFAGTNIDNYIGLLSGLGIIVTAIVHPEGVAPFFTEGVRHLGNWTVSAIPGAETLRSNYRGPKQVLVKVGLAILVVGTALWLYNAKFIESVEWWVFLSMVLLFLVMLAFARVVGPISPTFGEAGHVWASAGKRFGPTALVGYVLGWIIWPLRVDTYSMFWMPILGALIALMVRNVYLSDPWRARSSRRGTAAGHTPTGHHASDSRRGKLTWHCSKPRVSPSPTVGSTPTTRSISNARPASWSA